MASLGVIVATLVANAPTQKRRPKIAATSFERVLALGAALMFAALAVALGRGFGDWGRIPSLIWLHLATIGVALALTPVILLGKRGSLWHRRLGYIWASALMITALATFGIRTSSDGGLSPIHLLSVLTLIQLPRAIWAARRHRVDQHRRHLQIMVAGALVLAGVFTFVPGRVLGGWLLG